MTATATIHTTQTRKVEAQPLPLWTRYRWIKAAAEAKAAGLVR